MCKIWGTSIKLITYITKHGVWDNLERCVNNDLFQAGYLKLENPKWANGLYSRLYIVAVLYRCKLYTSEPQ